MKNLLNFIQKRKKTVISIKNRDVLKDKKLLPRLMLWNLAYEEEAGDLLADNWIFNNKTLPVIYFRLAEFYKFGIDGYFPNNETAIDYRKAAYWYVAAAGFGHEETIQFFYRMVPQYFVEYVELENLLDKIVEALNEQAQLVKAYTGETLEERKWRESVNNFVIDQFLDPNDKEGSEWFWCDVLMERFNRYLGREPPVEMVEDEMEHEI